MLSSFLALSIIKNTWMDYQKCCFTLYPSVNHLNHTKSCLRGGRTTEDIDGYLVLKILPSLTYKVGGRTNEDTNGYLVLKILPSHLRSGWTTKNTDQYLVYKLC